MVVSARAMDRRLIMGLVGATAAALALRRAVRGRARRARLAGRSCKLALLPSEVSPIVMMSPAISTVTFFRGGGPGSPAAAAAYLMRRVADIVAANPWLAAVLDTDPDTGGVAAFYPDKTEVRSPTGAPAFRFFEVRRAKRLHALSYDALVSALAPVLCVPGVEALGTAKPLFSVALIPDAGAPDPRYAVVVSANHSLVDGHGFYRLYNMLTAAAPVEALRPGRKQELPGRMLEAMGGEASLMAACPPGFLARFVSGQVRAAMFPQTVAMGFDVAPEWVAAQKKAAAAAAAASAAAAGGQVAFVSTNDCAVSTFLNCLRPDCAMMAINFRGRLEGCGEAEVGNYEDLITYMKGDYETSVLLRRSVSGPPYRRAGGGTAMLTNWEHLRGATYGVVTNWSTFARPLSLGVGTGEAELHLPLFDWSKAVPACILGSMVLFQPAEGRIAVMVAGKQELIDAVKKSGMVGAALGIEM